MGMYLRLKRGGTRFAVLAEDVVAMSENAEGMGVLFLRGLGESGFVVDQSMDEVLDLLDELRPSPTVFRIAGQ